MKILLAVCLLCMGYVLGSIEQPSQAESLYGHDNHGNSWSSHQSMPGAPTYYYGSDGTSGMYSAPSSSWMPTTKSKNPC